VQYTYRKLDSWGSSFFRILMRRDSSDAWQVVPGTFDYDNEEDARHTVQSFQKVAQSLTETQVRAMFQALDNAKEKNS